MPTYIRMYVHIYIYKYILACLHIMDPEVGHKGSRMWNKSYSQIYTTLTVQNTINIVHNSIIYHFHI